MKVFRRGTRIQRTREHTQHASWYITRNRAWWHSCERDNMWHIVPATQGAAFVAYRQKVLYTAAGCNDVCYYSTPRSANNWGVKNFSLSFGRFLAITAINIISISP